MAAQYSIDINCDLGESYGNFKVGNDEAVFPYLTSCNIACGFHGGDPLTIVRTIDLAIKHDVVIGAHPSYPDLMGFGRRRMHLNMEELKACVQYQVAALQALCGSRGTKVHYVKPHGALYNACFDSEENCLTLLDAICELDPDLVFMGLAGSLMQEVAEREERPFAAEAFADRRYTSEGKLQSRSEKGAVISSAEEAGKQVLGMIVERHVTSHDGVTIPLEPDSICIHGDNHGALRILQAIDSICQTHSIAKESFIS